MALGNLTVRLGLDAADYLSGLSKAEAEAAKFSKQQERTSLAIDKQVKALQNQSAALGFSERQVKIAELTLRGATDAQLKSADAALKQKEAFQEAAKAIANASAKAKATTDATAAIDKQVKALHDQVAVQGRSERQTKLYELTQQGATKAQLASADAALRQKAAYEGAAKFGRDLRFAIIGLGAALGAAAIAAAVLFEKFLGKAASFQDLAEKTGASAEALASFQVAASVTNTSMDTLANLSVKLTKGLAGTDEETKQAANAIKQLGLNVEDFKKLDPAAQFETIGKRLNEFEDGAGKTAFAVAALGRAGADALPFLKELGAQGQRNVILTAAQIKAADDYKDAQARLRAEVELYAARLAVHVLPHVQDFQKALFETAKQILGVSTEASKLSGNNGVDEFAKRGASNLAVLIDAVDLVLRAFQFVGSGIGAVAASATAFLENGLKGVRAVRSAFLEEVKAISSRPLFSTNLAAEQAARAARENAFESNFVPSSRPSLDPRRFGGGGRSGGANKAADEAAKLAKKQLDEQISQLENFIKQENRLLEERNHTLDRLYDQDRISIQDYFSGRSKALDDATFESADIYREQIDNLKKFVSETKDETLKLAALKEIGTKTERQADFLSDSSRKATKLRDDAEKALATYGARVDEVRIKVLELAESESNAAEIAARRFDASNAGLLSAANRQNDEETKRNLAILRQREVSQANINELLQKASVIEQNLATAQAKLHLERDLGMRGEIASLDLLGKSSVEAAAKLQIIADKYLAIAQAADSPVLIANAEAFKQKINEMAAATDILAAKIRQTFVETGASAIETFLNSVADGKNVLDSFKTAFTQFANDIIRQINRIAAQNIADALFKSGSGGGDGGVFGGIADAFVKYIAGLGAAEKGGPVSGSTPYVVGERGPEIFVPRTVASAATKQIDSLIAQTSKPAQYTDRVKAAAVATNLPHLIGAKGPEIFVPKVDGLVIPNDKVNKLSKVLQGRADGGPVVSATPYIVGERGPEIFAPSAAILGPHETVVTRLVSIVQPKASQVASNMPRVVGARGPELFVPKADTDTARSFIAEDGHRASLAGGVSAPRSASHPPFTFLALPAADNIIQKMLAVGRSSQPTDFDLSSERSSLVAPAAAVARRREISAPLIVARTILRDEKIITRYANAPYSRPVAAHVPYIGGREISKPANAAVQRDEAVSKLSTAFQKQGRGTSASVGSSAAIASRWSGDDATKTSRIIHERAPQVYIQQSVGPVFPTVIGAHQPSRFLTEQALKFATEPSKRAIAELALNAPRQRRADGGPVAASTPYVVGDLGPELFMPKSAERVINNEKARDDLVSNNIQHKASSAPKVTYIGEQGHEIFISKLASTNINNEKFITDLVSSNVQNRASIKNERVQSDLVSNTRNEKTINQLVSNIQRGPFAAHQTYLVGRPELIVRKSEKVNELVTNNVKRNEKIINDLVANSVHRRESADLAHQTVSSVQRRALGGPVAAHQKYLVSKLRPELYVPQGGPTFSTDVDAVRSGAESRDGNWVKNEKVIYDLITNTIQHKAQGGPVQARQTYIVGERVPELFVKSSAEKIIKNENSVSELVTNNAKRNEKVINDLVSKTAHYRQSAETSAKIIKNENRVSELVTNNARRNEKVINDLVSKTVHHREIAGSVAPDIADKIIKNESRVSNDVQRNEEIINRLVTNTRRDGGRSNQLLIVGANGPELFIPKAAGSSIKNERRIDELVSNIEHHNIDRSNEKTIDEIISSTVQRRAKGGPVAAYQAHLERGTEIVMGSETNITNNNGLSVPADFFSNASYRRAMGGPVTANQSYIVGERGPEWFVPNSSGRIIPNGRGGSVTNNIQFVLPPDGISRATQSQIAARVAGMLAASRQRGFA